MPFFLIEILILTLIHKKNYLKGCMGIFKTFAILSFLIVSNNLLSQTYRIGHTGFSLIDTHRGNRTVPVEIYYPADSSGDNVPISCVGKRFPVLCFGHGYLMSWDSYAYLRDALVRQGYIVAFPKTEGQLFPSHLDLAKDISFILRKISEYGKDNRSIFFDRVQNMNCAMGHSMGGGSAVLAARYDSTITALAALAPADTRPSAIKGAACVRVPALIISGEDDCITKPEAHQIPIYNNLQSISKLLLTIRGGSHCQMADKSLPCNLAEITCGPGPSITREQQQKIIIKYLVPWLNIWLKGDTASAKEIISMSESDTAVIMKSGLVSIF
jgi:predicted dienelactone hydrolase